MARAPISKRRSLESKITLANAEAIRRRVVAGDSPSVLAAEYRIAHSSVRDIVVERTHRRELTVHLTPEDFARVQSVCMTEDTVPYPWLIDSIFRIGLLRLLEVQATPGGE